MVHRQTIETYGRHAWPILLSVFQAAFIPLLIGYIQVVGSEFLFSRAFFWALCLSQLSSTPYMSHSFTLSAGLYHSISLRLSLPFIACGNGWTIDRLRSVHRLSLKMSGKNLGSRLGLSTLVGSNFGQTTIALM